MAQMLAALLGAFALLIVIVVLSLSVTIWISIVGRLRRREPVLPPEPRRPVPWRVGDMVVVFFLAIFALGLPALLARAGRPPDPMLPDVAAAQQPPERNDVPNDVPAEEGVAEEGVAEEGVAEEGVAEEGGAPRRQLSALQLALTAIVQLSMVAVIAFYLHLRSGATWHDFGLDRETLLSDVALGIVAFLAAAPPVYLLQAGMTQMFPSEHPLPQTLLREASPLLLLLGALVAVIVAPISEEFLFRVLLQGWLESVEQRLSAWRNLPTGVMPIMVSSVLFALAHTGHGPDPIPIFALAVVLGYVYQRTHRYTPCVVIHLCLNGASMLMLALALLVERLGLGG